MNAFLSTIVSILVAFSLSSASATETADLEAKANEISVGADSVLEIDPVLSLDAEIGAGTNAKVEVGQEDPEEAEEEPTPSPTPTPTPAEETDESEEDTNAETGSEAEAGTESPDAQNSSLESEVEANVETSSQTKITLPGISVKLGL